jgi:hypothetical protein
MLDSRQDFVSKKAEFIALKNNNQAQSKEIHEIRPDFANTTSPPPLSVLANYVKVELPSASFYMYIVSVKISDDDDGENVPRGKRQERMKLFVINSDYLKNAADDFATDNLAIIISWNELGKLKRGTPSKDLEVIDHRKRVIRESKTLSSGKVLEEFAERYTLTYHGKVAIDDLVNASKGNITSLPLHENLDLALQALNIVLSKATLNSAGRPFQIGSKKYFTMHKSEMLEQCVRGCKGFYSSFKLGMGSPLLNVSTATTAFYEPMSVDEFLTTFRPVTWAPYYSRAAKYALINVKVRITGQDGKIKAIKEFGRKPHEQTFWRADNDEPTVLDHTKEKKQLAKDHPALYQKVLNSTLPCANLGTLQKKEWIPVELLHIVEQQPFKIALSAQATSNMINFARQEPGVNRRAIVSEGRELLGITDQSNARSALSKANVRIEEALLEVPARRETPQTVTYAKNTTVTVDGLKGGWNLSRSRFFATATRFTGRIFFLFPEDINNKVTRDDMRGMGQELIKQMTLTGIQIPEGRNYRVADADIDTIDTNERVTQTRNSYQV